MRGEIRGLDGHLGEVRRLLQPLQALGGRRIGDESAATGIPRPA